MPKPNFPPHAGPYTPAWTADPRSTRYSEGQPRNRVAVEAEIERLRDELAQMQADQADYDLDVDTISSVRSVRMLWCAVGLCGGAVLFTIVAILYHG